MSKITKSHSTIIDCKSAEIILQFLEKNLNVKSFTAGFIASKKPPSRVDGPTKIMLEESALLININSKRSKQEIRVFGLDLLQIAKGVEKVLKENNLKVNFSKVY